MRLLAAGRPGHPHLLRGGGGPKAPAAARTLTARASSGRSSGGIRIARPEQQDLRHYCDAPIPDAASMQFLRQATTERYALKPRGFWLSEGDAWRQWSCEECFWVDKTAGYHPVVLKPEARLICMESDEDLAAVEEQFKFVVGASQSLHPLQRQIACIRWEAMVHYAQGMYLSQEMAEKHHHLFSFSAAAPASRFGYMVNAWDVGSAVLWDPKPAIASIGDWVESPPCPCWGEASEEEDPPGT